MEGLEASMICGDSVHDPVTHARQLEHIKVRTSVVACLRLVWIVERMISVHGKLEGSFKGCSPG